MSDASLERRLTTILAADVVGYSRLTAADEEGTLARLKAHRKELIEPKAAEYRGRVVKLMGDGTLMEFASAVDAVAFAAEVQRAVAACNAGVPAARQIAYRIGINIGDIVVEEGDILGDGVNIAARLEGLARPGSVCISDMVHETVSRKLDLSFEDLGERALKNIGRKIRVWHWAGDAVAPAAGDGQAARQPSLPDKPSIAVLPFENLSGEAEQDHFADGITEEIITTLSKISKLFVIARNSTLVYKGRAVDVKEVGREQGVRHVLEGSLRRSGDRLRITAQLIEAATGHHLWAERYDRAVGDVFALQDEVTKEIVSALQIELTEGEQAGLAARGTQSLDAWQLTFQARTLVHAHHQAGLHKARGLLKKALRLDENYALAWGVLAAAHWTEALNEGWSASRAGSLDLALAASDHALALDPENAGALAMRGLILLAYRDFAAALALAEKALLSAHNQANALATAAIVLLACGEPEAAIKQTNKAIRHCPVYPAWYLWQLGASHWALGHDEEATAVARSAIDRDPDFAYAFVLLAMVHAEAGRNGDARAAAAEVLRIDPDFSSQAWAKGMPYKDPQQEARQLAALKTAGLPA